MAIPKQITNNEQKDYDSIYQENFVKRNDPATIGTKAMNRQLGNGIKNTLGGGGNDTLISTPLITTNTPTDAPITADGTLMRESELGYTAASGGAMPGLSDMEKDKYAAYATGYGRSGDASGAYDSVEGGDGSGVQGGGGNGSNYNQAVLDEEARLNTLLDEEAAAINQQYSQQYNQMLTQAEQRLARGGASPFTGGIAGQVEDYMSAAEIQAMSQLAMNRDAKLKDIELKRGDVSVQALKNQFENLNLEMATVAQRFQYTQDLASYVIGGQLTIADAQAMSEQYGLENVQDTIVNAVQAQINSGLMPYDAALEELEKLGIDSSGITEPKVPETYPSFSLSETATNFESSLSDALDAVGGQGVDNPIAKVIGTTVAAAGTGAMVGGLPGFIIGGIAGLIGGIASNNAQNVSADDLSQVANPILTNNFMVENGQAFIDGTFGELTVTKPAGSSVDGDGLYNDSFAFQLDGGTVYTYTGADVMTLAVVLSQMGKSADPKYAQIFETAERVYNSEDTFGFMGISDLMGGKFQTVRELYKNKFNK